MNDKPHRQGRLDGQVAVVTGASAGIGQGIALRLAAAGAAVVVHGRSADRLQATVGEIQAAGGTASHVTGDVMSEADMTRLVASTVERHGRLDILVASASGATSWHGDIQRKVLGAFESLDIEDTARWVAQATAAKLMPAQAAARHMIGHGGGSIIFITSEGGRSPTPGQTGVATYAAGLIMSTKVLAKELAKHYIRVNTIAVTMVEGTPFFEAAQNSARWSEEQRLRYTRIADRAAFGLARPVDIAQVAHFLASDAGGLITGSTISPTGGLTFN